VITGMGIASLIVRPDMVAQTSLSNIMSSRDGKGISYPVNIRGKYSSIALEIISERGIQLQPDLYSHTI
jgi:hypothetical protein